MLAAPSRQNGVAIITALLLTMLAVTLVTSLFWLQQVQIRSLENQRVQMQTQSVVHTTIDWARRVLREDAAKSAADSLDEKWAIPLPETALVDTYLDAPHSNDAQGDARAATVSAKILDAQSRFNLRNLALDKVPDEVQLAIFRRLLAMLGQNPALARSALVTLVATQSWPPGGVPTAAGNSAKNAPLLRLDDLLSAPGFSPAVIERLRPHVVVLPVPTPVNVNTAGPVVLAASMNKSVAEIAPLIASRATAYFKDSGDFGSRAKYALDSKLQSVRTDFFLLEATVRFEHGGTKVQALIFRKSTGNTTVKWVRQS